MQVQRIENMFNFTFQKTSEEIVTAATKKEGELCGKIADRIGRIAKMRAEHNVTDEVLLDIQNQVRAQAKRGIETMSYTSNAAAGSGRDDRTVTVGAGVINFITTEQDFINGERDQVERLSTIIRNLAPITAYAPDGKAYTAHPKLTFEELKYLGF